MKSVPTPVTNFTGPRPPVLSNSKVHLLDGSLCTLHYSVCLPLHMLHCVDHGFGNRVEKMRDEIERAVGCCMVVHLHHDLVGDGFGNHMLADSQGTGRVHHHHTGWMAIHALNTRHKPSIKGADTCCVNWSIKWSYYLGTLEKGDFFRCISPFWAIVYPPFGESSRFIYATLFAPFWAVFRATFLALSCALKPALFACATFCLTAASRCSFVDSGTRAKRPFGGGWFLL